MAKVKTKIKIKTNSAAKKRFKKLSADVIKRSRAYHRHLFARKSSKRKMRLATATYVHATNLRAINKLLPYSY